MLQHVRILLVVIAAAASASPADAQPAAIPHAAAPQATTENVPRAELPFFTRADAITFGAFTLAAIAITPADRYLAERVRQPALQENKAVRRGVVIVRRIAAPGTLIIGGTLYAVGRVAGNERMATLGLHGTEAVVIGLGTVGVGKVITGRARPYATADTNPRDFEFMRGLRGGSDYQSFPSGHAVMAFAAAAAVTGETARWWPNATPYVGTVLYGGATLAGASRLYDRKHWASDVVVGAAIGTFVGQKVVRYHRIHPGSRVDRWLLNASLVPAANGRRVLKLGIVPVMR